jgi:hypothetical protein
MNTMRTNNSSSVYTVVIVDYSSNTVVIVDYSSKIVYKSVERLLHQK